MITPNGRILTGVVSDESGIKILPTDSGRRQDDIRRNKIDQLRATSPSLMPEGPENDISTQELADLIAYATLTSNAGKN